MIIDYTDYLERKNFFMGSTDNLDICDKVILGVPMDATTSFRSGTRLGPYRVREVSEGLEEYSIYQNMSLEDMNFYDAGDLIIPLGNVPATLKRAELVCENLIQNKKVFTLGGEHLISLPLIKAHKNKYPNLIVIQMDAHADLRHEYLGENLSHATVMRHVAEIVGAKNLFQLGIRSATKAEIEFASQNTHIYLNKLNSVVDEVIKQVGDRPVYISLDIDVVDPAFAPGTGTPEPGGVTSKELIGVLLELGKLNVVGFDLVEISPPNETGDITSILGATIMREVLIRY